MFLSDNGKTFKAASVFIKTVFKDSVVQDPCLDEVWTGSLM